MVTVKSKRRRILYIQKPTGGGSAVSLYELVRGLTRSLYEPVVLFFYPSPYRQQFEALGVRVITLCAQTSAMPVLEKPRKRTIGSIRTTPGYWAVNWIAKMVRRDLLLAWRVARLIQGEGIDLVHHNNFPRSSRGAVMGARLANVAQICHVRFWHNYSAVDRYVSRLLDSVVFISRAVEESCLALNIRREKGQVVYDPIDVRAFGDTDPTAEVRAEFGLSDGDSIVCDVGRLVPWKGQELFLRAWAKVIKAHPRARALVVGASDRTAEGQAYFRNLQQVTADLGLVDHVKFTGFRTDIPRIMSASDVVVHSASRPEPFGRVIVEGMAAGRPVVATRGGGVVEIIEDRINGMLVPLDDVEAIAKAIGYLLHNPEQARRIGERAKQDARQRFSVERHVRTIEQIYSSVLVEH